MTESNDNVRKLYEGGSFHEWLGLRFEKAEPGLAEFSIPHDESVTAVGDSPAIHGGILASLMDVAAGAAVRTAHDWGADCVQVTTHLSIAYLEPATGPVRAVGESVHVGNSSGVATVELLCRDLTVAEGLVSIRLFPESE